jgi:hypothetical protein
LELQSFPLQAKRHLLIWIIHQLSPLEYSFACSTFSVIPSSPLPQAMAGTDLLAVRQDKCGYLPNDVGCQHIGYCNENSWIFSQWWL